jgi:DNA-3-methyladenine glycosylase II
MSGDDLHRHLRILRRRCPHIRRAVTAVGLPEPRKIAPGFASLIRIIIDQQVSTKAGAAIRAKLEKACKGRVTARRLLALGEPGLRACGFSGAKARYARGVAEAVIAKRLDFKRLHAADDDTVRTTLTALKGIGPWSADIYLMFALGRADVWPVADLALQHGVRLLHGHAERPSQAEMEEIAEIWRPYRSGAAILLWRYYGAALKKAKPARPNSGRS